MKVTGLDGKKYTWSLASYVGNQNGNPSELHLRIRNFLESNYPALQVLEEVYIDSEQLYLDFYLPVMKIALEGMGIQHDQYNTYFFKNKLEFNRAKARDTRKAEFCRINNIHLYYFYPEEDLESWEIKMGLKKLFPTKD